MTRRRLTRTLSALVLLPALPHHAGGWAIVTVKELPTHAVVGQPLDLAYAVRQHGMKLTPELRGRVVARAGATEVSAAATPTGQDGRYMARLTLPKSGEWTITIHSGFMNSDVELLPLRAVAAGTRTPPALSEAERGRQLFAAKGCLGCHTHAESRAAKQMPGGNVGPDLTGRRFAADYLARYLADPSIKPPVRATAQMPDLELASGEIAALVAFLNTEHRVSGR